MFHNFLYTVSLLMRECVISFEKRHSSHNINDRNLCFKLITRGSWWYKILLTLGFVMCGISMCSVLKIVGLDNIKLHIFCRKFVAWCDDVVNSVVYYTSIFISWHSCNKSVDYFGPSMLKVLTIILYRSQIAISSWDWELPCLLPSPKT